MTYRLEIKNPLDSPGWDRQMLATGKAGIFHSAAWAATLSATYGYRPCYFVLSNGGNEIKGLVPLMEVSSFITGRRGISLPFSDHCEIISESVEDTDYLLARIMDHGRKRGWKYMELRSGEMAPDRPVSEVYRGHVLNLCAGKDELFSSFRESTRRNIRKAAAAGLVCTISRSMQAVEQFYALNCLTRKRHGVPPQPFSFFRNVHQHIISRNQGVVVLAYYKNRAIAGAVYFHFGRSALFKYGASDHEYLRLRGNYLVMWEAIRFCSGEGFDSLDLGRTDPGNSGLDQFKNGWNTQSRDLAYYRYSIKSPLSHPAGQRYTSRAEKVMQRLPLPLLRLIGLVAYRHVA